MGKKVQHDIIFLRHAESVGNAQSRWQGRADFPLTEKGQLQVGALVERWITEGRTFDRILASPLRRSRETAQLIGKALQLPLETDPIWMERDIGDVAGMTADEVNKRLPRRDLITPFAPLIGEQGEGNWALFLRAGQALQGLLSRPPGHYLVVSHGGLMNQIMYAVVGITPRANTSGPRFRFQNTGFAHLIYYHHAHRWQINVINDRSHWNGKDSD